MKKVLLVAASLAATGMGVACAQCPEPPPQAYRFLRFDDDFSFLRDPACRTPERDGWKAWGGSEGGSPWLTLGGDLRVKVVEGRNLVLGEDSGNPEGVVLTRAHAHANVVWGRTRGFVELKSNWEANREPGPLPADRNRIDVHQAFVDLAAGDVTLRLGRQELVYGSGRRIFPRNGPNVRGSFDAARLFTRLGRWRADAFVFRPVEIDPGSFDDSNIGTQTAGGMYLAGPSGMASMSADLYWLALRRQGARFAQGLGTEDRHTLGARLAGRAGPWDIDVEASGQWGHFGAGAIAAWHAIGDAGYTFDGLRRPRIGLRASVASGDRDPASPDLQTFNSLFPQGGQVDEFFSISPANLGYVRATIDFSATAALRLGVAAAWLRRTSDRDGVYNASAAVARFHAGSRSRNVGRDHGLVADWRPAPKVAVRALASRFTHGRYMLDGGTRTPMWTAVLIAGYRF